MRAIALDVGFNVTGWAVVDVADNGDACLWSYGDLKRKAVSADKRKEHGLSANACDARRCAELATQIADLIDEWGVRIIVAEMPTGGSKSSRAAACMAMAKAVVASVCGIRGLESVWVSPTDSKRTVAGATYASKEEVQSAVIAQFGIKGKISEHACDALAAYLHWQSKQASE